MIYKILLAVVAVFCVADAEYRRDRWTYVGGSYKYPVIEPDYGAPHGSSHGYKWVAPEPVLYGGYHRLYSHSLIEPLFYKGYYRPYAHPSVEYIASYGYPSAEPVSYRGYYGPYRHSIQEPEWGPLQHYRSGPGDDSHHGYYQRIKHSSSQDSSQTRTTEAPPTVSLLIEPTPLDAIEKAGKAFFNLPPGSWWLT